VNAETLTTEQALARLEEVAPNAPFLALGQTVFWDEPMKGGLALASKRLGYSRPFVAGVHDTDYFAKLPSAESRNGRFRTVPHNDTTTRGLWSAAAEFSALFGSETVVTREALQSAGIRIQRLERARPQILDEATEAWGWRGIVSTDEHAPVTAFVPIRQLFSELKATFDWALDTSLASILGGSRELAETMADRMRSTLCERYDEDRRATLSDYYRSLLPDFYEFAAGRPVEIQTTATTELLRFNRETCGRPRFDLLRAFVQPDTRTVAAESYDRAVAGSGLYGLARFGTGAVPFDLVIPGKGRGTLRIGNRGLIVMTPEPQFASLKRPIQSLEELAEVIERKFGPDCTLVGKAVALIGMLAREYVFVFHEGASGYVRHSRELHRLLAEAGIDLQFHPILRVRYRPWDALQVCCSWLKLPEPYQRPFGTEELCAPSFAGRWREVVAEQRALLEVLRDLRRPIDLIRHLDRTLGGAWNRLAQEYEDLFLQREVRTQALESVRSERRSLYSELRRLKAERGEAERKKGEHWRSRFFEKDPTAEDRSERQRLSETVDRTIHQIAEVQARQKELMRRQSEIASDPQVLQVHERRRSIALEAELKRLRLVRSAIITSKGLVQAGNRPSAWWFPLVCSDGLWFRETVEGAECYLEPLK
jgi:hypothetical protein